MARETRADFRRQPLGVPEILREALDVARKNGRLLVSISLLLLVPYSVIVWAHDRSVGPLLDNDDDDDDGEAFAGRRALGRLLCLEVTFFVAFCVVSLWAMVLAVYATYAACTGDHPTLTDTILRTLASWKKISTTCFYVVALTAAYAAPVAAAGGTLYLFAGADGRTAALVFLGSSAALFYAFLSVVWVLGVSVAAVEEGCGGMNALARGATLLAGRKLDGFLLMLLMLLLHAPVSLLSYLNAREDDQGSVVRLCVGVAVTAAGCLLKIFAFAAFSVFYCDCRRQNGEKVDGGAAEYELLSNIRHSADYFP